MDKNICIEKICSLPLDFKIKNKSLSALISESQFFIFGGYISPLDIEKYLTNNSNLVDTWLEWSNNKDVGHKAYFSLTKKNTVGLLDNNGIIFQEKSFNSKVEACAQFILIEIIEIIETKYENNYELDFDVLINASVEIGNLMQGKKIPEHSQIIYFAEGLSQKIIRHIMTARYLVKGYQLGDDKNLFKPMIDYASIIILTRAALETYLALNYVFIAENNEELKKFRFICWDLAGYMERADVKVNTEENIIKKQEEANAIESIKKDLLENAIFKSLTPNEQKKALKGEWRLNYKWHDLATKAGFNEIYFRQQYKFLCGYAHASRLSVIQIQQNKTFEKQKEMTWASIGTLIIILAKHMYDYIEIMPQLRAIKNDLTKYPIILVWKNFGDQMISGNIEEENI